MLMYLMLPLSANRNITRRPSGTNDAACFSKSEVVRGYPSRPLTSAVGCLKWFEVRAGRSSIPSRLPAKPLLLRRLAAVHPIGSIVTLGVDVYHPPVFTLVTFCSFNSCHVPSPWQQRQPTSQSRRTSATSERRENGCGSRSAQRRRLSETLAAKLASRSLPSSNIFGWGSWLSAVIFLHSSTFPAFFAHPMFSHDSRKIIMGAFNIVINHALPHMPVVSS